jgi:hypothetical protein
MKYNYKIVPRRSLAELEQRVRLMEAEGWELHSHDEELTISQALNFLAGPEKGMVAVSMRIAILEEPRTRPLQGGYWEKDTVTGEMREPVIQRRDDYQK